jgi:site-specific DNA-methyltransferase (adenine-specific)
MQAQPTVQSRFVNTFAQGDCIRVMREMPANSVDFILTESLYLVDHRDRSGRRIQNAGGIAVKRPSCHPLFQKITGILCSRTLYYHLRSSCSVRYSF